VPKPSRGIMAAFAVALILAFFGLQDSAAAQSKPPQAKETPEKHPPPPAPDLTSQPTLFVVGYAHLDTQWRWEYPQVINEYILHTMRDNFDLFPKYPHYIFNFSGANRYRLMKEYYPADFAKVKEYVAAGRWFPAGSSMEESDVNSPAAESIIRQVLYGNEFFRGEFGKASAEYMLPDCFGFPSSLPSLLAHAGIKGFSTQKLTWHSAAPVGGPGSVEETPAGIPFNVGLWDGPDGRSVIAAFNPGPYDGAVNEDLSASNKWINRIQINGKMSGLFTDYHYYGTGDIGGAAREPSVKLLEAIVTKGMGIIPPPRNKDEEYDDYEKRIAALTGPEVRVGDGPLHVVSSTAEQMFLDILKTNHTGSLPHYAGDLLLIEHSAGSLTSEAYHKRWNRKNELLADAAERASLAAAWLGGRPYPQQRLNDAWTLVMGGQFHDIMAGTATPQSYNYSWNDDVLAMNQFSGVLTSATSAVASGLDTRAKGTALVVYNPLNIEREDVVEASVLFPGGIPRAIRVLGPDGQEVASQINGEHDGSARILFLAKLPSVGYAVYDVQAAPSAPSSALKVTDYSLENDRYRVQLDQNGDVSSIFDKSIDKELLLSPIRLALQTENPHDWPAWNMDWKDQQKPPRAYVQGPATIRVIENGPVRVAVEVDREAEGSRFIQTIRLSSGDAGNRLEIGNVIDWRTASTALKAVFPLTAANPEATYNWDAGTIQRGNNNPKKYEVPSHQWFDLTDQSGAYGLTVLSDCKYGSDKPDDNTLRLTLIYTPGLGGGNGKDYSDQTTQDWGHHELIYGIASHAGDWRQEQTDWQALRLNQPLIAFESPQHPGALGKSFSLLHVNNSRVRVLALKKAEATDEVIVRFVEMSGKQEQNVRLAFPAPIASAREMDGQEMALSNATVEKGELLTDFSPYQLRTFAVKLGAAPWKVSAPQWQPVTLSFDRIVASSDGTKSSGGFDGNGRALPAEMLPVVIPYSGIRFNLEPATGEKPNALAARGQTIILPAGKFNRLYILAASADGDQNAAFKIGSKTVHLTIQDWSGFIGQWDNRTWTKREIPIPSSPGAPAPGPGTPPKTQSVLEFTGNITPGYIRRAPVAWFASHRHTAEGANEPYSYSYLFAYEIDVPVNARTLTLPENDKIHILAITAANDGDRVRPAQPLYDTLERTTEP
jgi:alpha-mannosidase